MRYKTTFQTPKGTAFLSHQANNGIQPKLNAVCLFYPILFDRCRFRNFSQITVLSAQRETALLFFVSVLLLGHTHDALDSCQDFDGPNGIRVVFSQQRQSLFIDGPE